MKILKKQIRKITLSSVLSALIVVFLLLGSFIETLDLTVCALCTLIVFVCEIEIGEKYPLLVYLTSCVLSLIFQPLSTATLYFVAFFGYYPILRKKMKKLSKRTRKLICAIIYNMAMILLMLVFKAVFALQNEPWQMYLVLLVLSNVFFFCFDYLLDMFSFIYIKKIRTKFKFKF